MPWLEWCPDPQQPGTQWVKIFHPGSWTPQGECDDPPPRHTYREWKEFYTPDHAQDGVQHTSSTWYKRDWTTEGYRRVAAPQPDVGYRSMASPDQHNAVIGFVPVSADVGGDSSFFGCFGPAEDLTRIQAGICQQLSDRARHDSHRRQPVRAFRGVEPPESVRVADPYLPATQPCSSANKEKPIWSWYKRVLSHALAFMIACWLCMVGHGCAW